MYRPGTCRPHLTYLLLCDLPRYVRFQLTQSSVKAHRVITLNNQLMCLLEISHLRRTTWQVMTLALLPSSFGGWRHL
jgi:hypothetical protein